MHTYSLRRLLWAGPVATIAAILANLLYFDVTKALGVQYRLPLVGGGSHFFPMSALMPVVATLVPGLLATIFFALLIRFSHKPATVFLSVAVAALILSFGGPFNLPAGTLQTKILLSGMHLIAAGLITSGILLISRQNVKIP